VFPAGSQNERINLSTEPNGFRQNCVIRYVNLLIELGSDAGQDDTPVVLLRGSSVGAGTLYLPLTTQGKMVTEHPNVAARVRRLLVYSRPVVMREKKNGKLQVEFQRDAVANSNEMYYDITIVADR
jgi:hypothetical protein